MLTNEFDFELPTELIAQVPSPRRSASRLMHFRRADGSIAHRTFSDLPRLLRKDDLLVLNDSRVIPARFLLRKPTGGLVEGLFLGEAKPGEWSVLLKNLGPAAIGAEMEFADDAEIKVRLNASVGGGEHRLLVDCGKSAVELLERLGRMPLPPYIHRQKSSDPRDGEDLQRYQTIYARRDGSIAAPTAGLHFSPAVLEELDSLGIERAFLTLHVGLGTFKPVTAQRLEDHPMHAERFSVDASTADALNRAQSEKKRIVAVGTTAARVLESWPSDESWREFHGETSIFIFPPYRWKRVGALLTNFHLPRSTLVALVAALVGLEEQRRIYRIAIEQQYRFFSYGDAMLIE